MADAEPKIDDPVPEYSALKKFWKSLNLNDDGVIDGKEWGRVVGARLDEFKNWFPGETPKDIGQYFNKADTDDDHTISWSEFVAAADLGELKKLYMGLDMNGDGKVSSIEWGNMLADKFKEMKAIYGGKTKADIGKKFNLFNVDKAKDAVGEQFISWGEFYKGWFNTQVVPEFVDLKKLWDNLDKNEDGRISSKEWGQAVTANAELMKKLFGGSTLKEIGQYFNIVDADEDKNLSWKEVAKAYTYAAEIGDLKKIFLEMDIDGSGYVDSKEWGRQLSQYKDRLGNFFMGKSISELGPMFNKIDTNHDDKISWDEIQVAVKADQDQREEAQELMKVADIDAVNDSTINFLETKLKFKTQTT